MIDKLQREHAQAVTVHRSVLDSEAHYLDGFVYDGIAADLNFACPGGVAYRTGHAPSGRAIHLSRFPPSLPPAVGALYQVLCIPEDAGFGASRFDFSSCPLICPSLCPIFKSQW